MSKFQFCAALLVTALASIVPHLTQAQDADGTDRPSNWRVTHQQTHGIWTTACDERGEGTAFEQRCYIRWVDVFSPRPAFAAQFLFVTADDVGPTVEFGLEAGTFFAPGNFRIEKGDVRVWSTLRPGCLTGLSCAFSGKAGQDLLNIMQGSGEMAFDFRDRHGKSQSLRWPLEAFSKALADFNVQSATRTLPKITPAS